MLVFLCFLFVQIAPLKGLLSAAALGVHTSWVCLIEVAFAHKDTSQPNPNTIHIYVSPSSSGFRQSQWGSLSQAWSCMSSCGGAVQFLFYCPSCFWILISSYIYFLTNLLSLNATWSKYSTKQPLLFSLVHIYLSFNITYSLKIGTSSFYIQSFKWNPSLKYCSPNGSVSTSH